MSEDLFYILAFIGWILYSVYKYNAKSKEKSSPAQTAAAEHEGAEAEKNEGRSYFEDLMREFKAEEETVAAEEPADDTLSRKDRTPEPQGATSYEEPEEGRAVKAPVSPDKKDHSMAEEQSEIAADFDLRKAVIYSEIMNRPYK